MCFCQCVFSRINRVSSNVYCIYFLTENIIFFFLFVCVLSTPVHSLCSSLDGCLLFRNTSAHITIASVRSEYNGDNHRHMCPSFIPCRMITSYWHSHSYYFLLNFLDLFYSIPLSLPLQLWIDETSFRCQEKFKIYQRKPWERQIRTETKIWSSLPVATIWQKYKIQYFLAVWKQRTTTRSTITCALNGIGRYVLNFSWQRTDSFAMSSGIALAIAWGKQWRKM